MGGRNAPIDPFGEPGGEPTSTPADGPSQTPTDGFEPLCKQCHNPTHSMGFEYVSFFGKISHAVIAQLGPAERESMLAGRGKPRELLPTTSNIAGSEACKSCHEAEHATWSRSPHRHAVDTLANEGKQDERECLACHTTAMGRPGGFPADGKVRDHTDLASVGCESCHGPGGLRVRWQLWTQV